MLIVSRRQHESIIIGDGIRFPFVRIELVEVGRDRCRLGIAAPHDVPVWRREILPEDLRRAMERGAMSRGHGGKDGTSDADGDVKAAEELADGRHG